ncbi:WASH complex subunit 2 [Ochlerotatus camptorhynchus]|uniref:WASH complex subunit 2 n=1 Tax=Ochlerotatus camptorhynchus TaxID=644619 RepID=UPI0031CDD109
MALTPDELRERIPQWSLESDGQLLQYMVQISKNLEEKCKQTQDNLTRLLLEVDESHIRFANASNSFNGIQQLKFVENRVQDDDESFYSVREEEEEKGEKLPYGEIFHMAVEKSVANMYKSFEKVTVQLDSDSDSDDDDDDEEAAARNTVLRAVQKYPYINRPLPYIIGSQEWREKWHAGLIDSDEESDTETKEQYSDSSDSERMFPSQTNSNHTPSESEGSVWGVHSDPRKRAPSIDPSMSGDDALSIHSSSSVARPPGARSLLNNPHKVQMLPGFRPPSLFPDQPPPDDTMSVSSRSKVANLFEESDEEESTPTHRPTMVTANTNNQPTYFRGNQPERKTINLFTDEPPPSHGSHAPTPTSSISSNSQKKPINLFIDSDDDDSYNNNPSSKSNSIYQNEPPELPVPVKKNTNIFDDDEEVTPKANPTISGKPVGNIFDKVNNNRTEVDEVEDDLFVPVQRSINGATDGRTGVRRVTNLFDDDPPEDDFDKIFKAKGTDRKIPGGKLVLPPAPIGGKQSVTNTTNSQQPKAKSVPVVAEQVAKKKINLFDDDDDDDSSDIFSARVGSNSSNVTKPKINLFDDDDEGNSALIGSKLPQIDSRLRNDTNQEQQIGEAVKPKEAIANHGKSIRSENIKKKSIFDSDSNEDDDDDDDFLFGAKRSVPSLVDKKEPKPLPRKEKVASRNIAQDLKDSSSEQVSKEKLDITFDLPGSNGHEVEPKLNQAQASIRSEILKKKSIFDSESDEVDEDIFFGGKHSATNVVEKKDVHVLDLVAPNVTNLDNLTNANDTSKVADLREEPVIEKVKGGVGLEKPQIPDEPPEDDGWEEPPPDDHGQRYPDVSNDIDYYLTTNRINGTTETSSSTLLVQTKHDDLIEDSLMNGDSNVGNSDEPSENIIVKQSNEGGHNSSKVKTNDVSLNSADISPGLKENSEDKLNDNSNNKSALNFNSVGLFDDIPPPDDDFEEPRSSLAIDHTDDGGFFNVPDPETSSNAAASSNTNHYLFMDGDGPPPDDEVDDGKAVPKVQEPASFKSISSIIEERNKNESSYEGIREKPKVNRLSAKVNINVNALLPGARRPQSAAVVEKTANEPVASSVAIPDIPNVEGSVSTTEPKPKLQQEPEIGTAKLTSLNKGRAKIQTKRKPPSRQNRRTNYENNLASETNEDFNYPPAEKSPKEEIRVVVGSEQKVQHVEVTAAHVKIDQILSSELAQKLSEPKLFEDSGEVEDILFGGSGGTKRSTNSTVPKKSILPIVEPPSRPLTSEQPAPPKLNTSTKLFSDEESDDGDLFGTISKPIQKPPAMQTTATAKPIKQQEVQPGKSATTSTLKKQSIFDDSDEGDDIFSKPRTNGKPPTPKLNVRPSSSETSKKPTSKSKSIFGSDEESDGDDIFGGSKQIAKPQLKVSEAKKSVVVAASTKSLFGEDDDDEDDDLFGSKSKPAPKSSSSQPATKNTVKNPSKSNTVAAAAEDDPLADLLK